MTGPVMARGVVAVALLSTLRDLFALDEDLLDSPQNQYFRLNVRV